MLIQRMLQNVFIINVFAFVALFLMVSIGLAQDSAWVKKESMPTRRCFASSCELNGKIYVLGGAIGISSRLNVMEVYDPATNTWDTTKAPMPTARVELCVAAVNGKIYAIGGGYSNDGVPLGMVEEYDPENDTWDKDKTPMPTARKGAAYGVFNNKIYVAGGTLFYYNPSDKLEIYDPATDEWTSGADMLAGRYDPEGAVLNDTFYVIGGLIGVPWTGQGAVQKYDPVTDHWEWATDLNYGRVGLTANVVNGKIYVIGGDQQPPLIMDVEEYDPRTETWTVIDTIPNAMNKHTSSVYKDKIYVFGGSTKTLLSLSAKNNVYSFDPSYFTSINDDANFQFPLAYKLGQNYPNPFNPATTIEFNLLKASDVRIEVYNIAGQKIQTLLNKNMTAGNHQAEFNAENLSSGVYFYKIEAGEFQDVKKMILLK